MVKFEIHFRAKFLGFGNEKIGLGCERKGSMKMSLRFLTEKNRWVDIINQPSKSQSFPLFLVLSFVLIYYMPPRL